MLYSVEIGKNIVDLRHAHNFSQEELADRSGLSVSYLRDVEHGRANPSLDVLESIANALKVDLSMLFVISLPEDEVLTMMHQAKEKLEVAGEKTLAPT